MRKGEKECLKLLLFSFFYSVSNARDKRRTLKFSTPPLFSPSSLNPLDFLEGFIMLSNIQTYFFFYISNPHWMNKVNNFKEDKANKKALRDAYETSSRCNGY